MRRRCRPTSANITRDGRPLHLFMQASHCPDVEPGWTHDGWNFQIRLWSCRHRGIREAILSHRMTIGGDFQASAATSGAVTKSLTCQRIPEASPDGSISCWVRVSILPFVRPSGVHRECILSNRVNFVWSSVPFGIFRLPKATRRIHEAARWSKKATRRREALAMPSCSHRIIVGCHRDGLPMSAKTAEFE